MLLPNDLTNAIAKRLYSVNDNIMVVFGCLDHIIEPNAIAKCPQQFYPQMGLDNASLL